MITARGTRYYFVYFSERTSCSTCVSISAFHVILIRKQNGLRQRAIKIGSLQNTVRFVLYTFSLKSLFKFDEEQLYL